MIVLNGLEDDGENTFFSSKKGESMIDFISINYEFYCNEEEDEDIEDFTHKLERRDKRVQTGHSEVKCTYVRNSLKVWQDFSHIISDHRLVTCQLKIQTQLPTTHQSRELREKWMVTKATVPKWKRRNKDDQTWGEFRTKVTEMLNGLALRGPILSSELVRCMHAAAQQSLGQIRPRLKRKTLRLGLGIR